MQTDSDSGVVFISFNTCLLSHTGSSRATTLTPTDIDSPEPSSELPRLVEKLPAEEEEKEEEEMVVGGSVEEKAGWGMEDGFG